jgi:D-alanyl-D-alanine carboxypeptidase
MLPKNHTLRLFFSLLLLFAALAARAQEVEKKVDEYVRAEMEKRHIPGVSIAVVKEGKPLFAKGYGLANVEFDAPAAADTVYQLASVTKQFTATAILLLAEDGKLSLDDKIAKFVPDAPSAWEGVTVRHLLNHTSGIKSYTSLPDFMSTPGKAFSHSDMLKLIAAQPMDFQPGEKWTYNNSGYYLLGMIIEKASGKEYGEFLAERIFKPLGMTSTRFNSKALVVKGRAVGYTRASNETRNAEFVHPSQPYSAGALISTVNDMAKWDAALYSDKVLKKAVLDIMWTPTQLKDGKTQDYGFGWSVGKIAGHREIGHGGGIPGFSTQISRFVDDKLTVIVLTNLDSGNAGSLARGIAAVYIPELAPKPAVAAAADKDPQATEMLRKLLLSVVEDKADQELFTPEARADIFPDKAKQAGAFLKTLGALKSLEPVEQEKTDTERRYRYRVTYADTKLLCNLVLNKEGKIASINMMPE